MGPLSFVIISQIYLSKQRKNQELFSTIFCIVFSFVGVSVHYKGLTPYFLTPEDSFTLGVFFGGFDRLVCERISNIKYKRFFSITSEILRLSVVTPFCSTIWLRQILLMMAILFFDLKSDQKDQHLFKGYFDYKEQLVKFKNLVVHDIPEAIVVVSGDLSQSFWTNKAFTDLTGKKFDHDVKTQLDQFLLQTSSTNSKQTKTLLSFIQACLPGNEKHTCNLKYGKEAAEKYLFEAKLLPIIWDNQAALAIILHDVTQQRTIMSLQIADSNKDKVLATVSHELRTPLNGILGVVQIMQKRIQDPEILHLLSICKNSSNLLIGFINSILDLNQIRFKKLELNPERIDLQTFFKDIIGLFEFQCQQKGLDLRLDISGLKTRSIVTDRNRLSQIFINLLGNALKFTFKGGITIFACETKDNEMIEFNVIDTGIGIKQEDQVKLFQIFGKLNQKTNVNHEGIGLGLTISDALVRALKGGDDESRGIKLESTQGQGSCFSFFIRKDLNIIPCKTDEQKSTSILLTESSMIVNEFNEKVQKKEGKYLPRMSGEIAHFFEKVDHTRSRPSLSPQKTSSRNSQDFRFHIDSIPTQNPHILLIDDNPFNLTVAKHLILLCGFQVKTALHGNAAIELLLNNNYLSEPIGLIFMDCQMPIMDGYQTTRALKDLMIKKRIPNIPIVALTANDSDEDRKQCLESGMVDHIAKPLKESELQKIIKQYCKF